MTTRTGSWLVPALRGLAVRAGVLAVAVLLSLLLLEAGVRWTMPQFRPEGQVFWERLPSGATIGLRGYTGRQVKNTGDFDVPVRINAVGFRDGKELTASTEGDPFVLGDSFTFGWGVEESERYSDVLGRLTGERVYNIGVPNADVADYRRILEYAMDRGAKVGHLVVGICMENDLKRYGHTADPGAPAAPSGGLRARLDRVKLRLASSSATYRAVTTVIHSSPELKDAARRVGIVRDVNEDLMLTSYDRAVIEASVEELKKLAEGRQATFLIIPSRALYFGPEKQRAEARRIHEDFVALLRASGSGAVLDPDSTIRQDPPRYHFRYDGHWNARGHEVAGRALAAA